MLTIFNLMQTKLPLTFGFYLVSAKLNLKAYGNCFIIRKMRASQRRSVRDEELVEHLNRVANFLSFVLYGH